MSTIKVGCAGFSGPEEKYWEGLDLRELPDSTMDRVKVSTLGRWSRKAPANRTFALPAAPELARTGFVGPEAEAAWARTVEAAAALEASAIVVHTSGAFRPSAENRAAVRAFFTGPGANRPEGCSVAWRAEGLWEGQPEDHRALCDASDLIPVLDPLAMDEDDFIAADGGAGPFYWRLLGRAGLGARLSDYDIDALLDLVEERPEGYVIFGTINMLRQARHFRAMLGPIDEADDAE